MRERPKLGQPVDVDARYASWLASSSSATVGYHMSYGLSLSEKNEMLHGYGPGWQERAAAAVLREYCESPDIHAFRVSEGVV